MELHLSTIPNNKVTKKGLETAPPDKLTIPPNKRRVVYSARRRKKQTNNRLYSSMMTDVPFIIQALET
jgi:hypothetical protein